MTVMNKMEKNFLQQFLETGMFDVGDNDTRLENLESSISDLEKKLTKEINLIPVYTLVALDPKVSEKELVLDETERIVTDHWRALRTKYPDRPVPILRGVLLNALYNLGKSDVILARIIYLTATNFYPFAELNKEAGIVNKLLSELSATAEENAVTEWALLEEEPALEIPVLEIGGLEFGDVDPDTDAIEAGMLKALKNTSQGYGPQHGADSVWGKQFVSNTASTISDALTKSFNEFGESLSPSLIEDPINEFFAKFKNSLDEVLKSSFNSIQAVERRSKLLWWKETLYSSSLQCGYRQMSPILQSVMMAYDLFILLPAITPVSVDYLLKDTLRLVNSDLDKEIEFEKLLQNFQQEKSLAAVKPYLEDVSGLKGRVTVTDFLRLLIHDRVKVEDFTAYTGISPTRKTSLSNLTVIILHDLMVEHLLK
jgi:hypothetical protein